MTRNNKIWHSSCKHCASTLTNIGSSRPKRVCRPCRLQQMRQVSERRYIKQNRTANLPKLNVMQRNKQVVIDEKLRRGSCLLCNLKVTKLNAAEFDFDHRNPQEKTSSVSRLKSGQIDRLVNEMAKCDLLCCQCHRRKTLDNKDFTKPATRVLQTALF